MLIVYMTFTISKQKRAGARVKQAPTLLHDPVPNVLLTRNMAIFAIAFTTTKREVELR